MTLKHTLCLALFGLAATGLFAEDDADIEHYAQVAELDARITVECPALFQDKEQHVTRFIHRYSQELAVNEHEAKIRPHLFRCELTPNNSESLEWKVRPNGWGSWREITALKVHNTSWSVQTTPNFPGKMITKMPDAEELSHEVQQVLELCKNMVNEYRGAPLVLHTMGPDVVQEWLATSSFFKGQRHEPKLIAGRMRLKAASDWQTQTSEAQERVSWEILRSWEPFLQVIEAIDDMDPEVSAKCSLECHWNPTDKLDYRFFLLMDIRIAFTLPNSQEKLETVVHLDRKLFSDK